VENTWVWKLLHSHRYIVSNA